MARHDVASPFLAATALAALLLVPSLAVDATAGVGLEKIEFLTQSVKLSGQSFSAGMGLRFHLAGGDLNDGLAIVPAIEYWRDSDKLPELYLPEVMQKDWRIGADLRYRLGHNGGWRPYGGAGLAVHSVASRVTIDLPDSPPQTQEDKGTKLAPNLLIGVDLPAMGPIRNSIEFNWHFVPDLREFKVNFGIGYAFGPGAQPEGPGADEKKVY